MRVVLGISSSIDAMKHNVRTRITNTEASLPVTSLAVDEAGKPPEGPGWAGYNPLMRNRQPNMAAPIGILPATLSISLMTNQKVIA